jgi:hypothetical protein
LRTPKRLNNGRVVNNEDFIQREEMASFSHPYPNEGHIEGLNNNGLSDQTELLS